LENYLRYVDRRAPATANRVEAAEMQLGEIKRALAEQANR